VKLKRLLGAENGWGGAAGTLLLLVFGAFFVIVGVAGMSDAARVKPMERTCAEWLTNSSGAKWVTLTGCKLDVTQARSEDGRVLVPIFVDGMTSRSMLSTQDTELIALKDSLATLPAEEAKTFLSTHGLAAQPQVLTGYFESGVLMQGKQPERTKTVVSLLVGLVAIALAVRSVFMRFLVERDSTM
jgi:hypothetical protein